jgi:hypothetical protein
MPSTWPYSRQASLDMLDYFTHFARGESASSSDAVDISSPSPHPRTHLKPHHWLAIPSGRVSAQVGVSPTCPPPAIS